MYIDPMYLDFVIGEISLFGFVWIEEMKIN